MDNLTNFDKLIINLSSNEKKELLEKMEITFDISQEPLAVHEEIEESDFKSFQQEYESLTIIQKIFLFLQSIIAQKDIPSLLKEHKVNILRKKYFNNCDLADFKNSLLKQPFYDELVKLKEPIQFFRKPLQAIFSYDNKRDFYAFIGGVILPDLQNELLMNTDPWEIEKNNLEQEDSSIKSEIDSFLELKMDSISNLDCTIMNEACQSLYGLHLLCSFELNIITCSFDSVTPETGKICQVDDIKELLLDLAGILQSLSKPPTIRALEAMFLFSIENQELKTDLGKKMVKADVFLSSIRDFNKKVPLENLVKVLTADLSKKSTKPPIVEDWFRVYKKFWNSRVSKKYSYFVTERKKSESEKDICAMTGIKLIKPMDRYFRNFYFMGSPAKYEKSMAFIQAFMNEIIPITIYPTLMVISREGEFYKKDNKAEFEKVLNFLSLLDKKINNINSMINSSGFLGEKLKEHSDHNEEQKNRIIINALEQIDFEIASLIDIFISNLRAINKVMHGIVVGDGGAYDTLSNISSIGGRSNAELRETFKLTSLILNKIVKYISSMKIMEEKEM